MSFRDAARQAWEDHQNAQDEARRQQTVDAATVRLEDLLGAYEVDPQVADVAFGRSWRMVVFTDGTTNVAVREVDDGWDIRLVGPSDDGWTALSGPLSSLLDLYEALPEPEPEVPEWQPNEQVGPPPDWRTYGGVTYELIQPHTTQVGWEPPAVPALWRAV